ncbi:MAG: site-2 protease family protein [Armatimonadetes bacterium]|nr:site-2 protease family protein [Armatimonadota bacterium]
MLRGLTTDPLGVLMRVVAVVIAITVHEYAHAKRAQLAGDPTPGAQGRVTLNPIAHLDPIGTLLLLLFGLGWGKPVQIDPSRFRRPRWDEIMVSAWGPMANFVVAVLFALPFRFGLAGGREDLFIAIILINLLLGFFNLLPVYPLDGSHIVENMLPRRQAVSFAQFSHRYGIILLILIIVTPVGDRLFVQPALFVLRFLVGM